jgi:Flp pilus assembly pilin Flp
MKSLVAVLIDNESGLILSAEMVLILTICVLGIVVGLSQVQAAVVAEFQDIGLAFSGLNQSYFTPGFVGCRKIWGPTSWTAGSGFIDFYDGCIGGGTTGGGFAGGGFGGGGYGGGYSGGYSEIGGASYSCPQPGNCPAPVTSPVVDRCETCPPGTVTTIPTPSHGTPGTTQPMETPGYPTPLTAPPEPMPD